VWTRLCKRLPPEDDWQVWIDWYEERLRGGSRGEAYEIVFATVPEDKWKQGAKAANAWIREHLPPDPSAQTPPEPDPAALEQKAAPHVFRLDGARIVASPAVGAPDNARTTQSFLDARASASPNCRSAPLAPRPTLICAITSTTSPLCSTIRSTPSNSANSCRCGKISNPTMRTTTRPKAALSIPSTSSRPRQRREIAAPAGRAISEAKALVANQTELAFARDAETAARVQAALENLATTAASATQLVGESAVAALRTFEASERGSRTLADKIRKLTLGALDALTSPALSPGSETKRCAQALRRPRRQPGKSPQVSPRWSWFGTPRTERSYSAILSTISRRSRPPLAAPPTA